tara:strand:- start:1508 stop:3373 length:1866 start_codon:yes stop_codon:yes gene_type:complete
MATNIKNTTIASSYDRLVLIEDGATISSGTSTVNVEIQTPSGVATATPLHISTDRIGIGADAPAGTLQVGADSSDSSLYISNYGSISYTGSTGTIGMDTKKNMTFTIDSDNNDSTEYFSFKNASTEHVRIKADGDVGIGTNNPYALLELGSTSDEDYSATAKTDAQLQGGTTLGLLNTNTDDENYAQILFRLNQTNTAIARIVAISESNNNVDLAIVSEGSDNATEKLRIKADGKVGVGTDAPSSRLHVQNVNVSSSEFDQYATMIIESAEARLELVADNSGHASGITLSNVVGANDINQWVMQHRGTSTGAGSTSPVNTLAFGYNDAQAGGTDSHTVADSNEILSLTTSGKVGIGTNNPDKLLHISSSGTAELHIDGGANAYLLLDASSDSDDSKVIFQKNGSSIGSIDYDHNATETSAVMKFNLNIAGSEDPQMVIKASGAVGIGTDNPGYRLEVKGAADDAYVALFDNVGTGATAHGIQIKCGDSDHSNDSSTHYIQFLESDGGVVGEIDNGGGSGGDLRFIDGSDERLKENIKDSSVDGLKIINGLRMREFNWKKRYNKSVEKCGLIAQEVQKVFPSAVTEMGDADKTLGLAKTSFIYTLIKAVQELSAKVTALESA